MSKAEAVAGEGRTVVQVAIDGNPRRSSRWQTPHARPPTMRSSRLPSRTSARSRSLATTARPQSGSPASSASACVRRGPDRGGRLREVGPDPAAGDRGYLNVRLERARRRQRRRPQAPQAAAEHGIADLIGSSASGPRLPMPTSPSELPFDPGKEHDVVLRRTRRSTRSAAPAAKPLAAQLPGPSRKRRACRAQTLAPGGRRCEVP